MKRNRLLHLIVLGLASFVSQPVWAGGETHCPSSTESDAVSKAASAYLAQISGGPRDAVVASFYRPCSFALAWTRNGELTPQARALISELDHADQKGLRPGDYGSPLWGSRSCALEIHCEGTAIERARFDADLTAAAMRYLSDLVYGRARPHNPKAGYDSPADQGRLAALLWSNIVSSDNVKAAFQHLEPRAPGYLRAEAALQRLLFLAAQGTDIALPSVHQVIHPGDTSAFLPTLIARLQQLGELPSAEPATSGWVYDDTLIAAVKHFQTLHGIAATGTIDGITWKQLSVPLERRVTQLALTLERWRWVPQAFAEPPIVVNIPEYRVRAYDNQLRVVLSMPVIVGRAANRKSPILQAELTQVIFHPYWNVPKDIQQHEIAPHVARDPRYLGSHDYQVVNRDGRIVNSNDSSVLRGIANGSLRVRQIPGKQNALGAIKFVFPNAFDVYMHGTPEQQLFKNARRDFSHGCIRVEDPMALAWWVLQREPGWSEERIAGSIANPKTSKVVLSRRIPVLVVYGTGIAAEDGSVRFFDDIYGHDRTLESSLNELSRARKALDSEPW